MSRIEQGVKRRSVAQLLRIVSQSTKRVTAVNREMAAQLPEDEETDVGMARRKKAVSGRERDGRPF